MVSWNGRPPGLVQCFVGVCVQRCHFASGFIVLYCATFIIIYPLRQTDEWRVRGLFLSCVYENVHVDDIFNSASSITNVDNYECAPTRWGWWWPVGLVFP